MTPASFYGHDTIHYYYLVLLHSTIYSMPKAMGCQFYILFYFVYTTFTKGRKYKGRGKTDGWVVIGTPIFIGSLAHFWRICT